MEGKQQQFGLRGREVFLSRWMSRLEVVVGWDWAGAMGGMLCFPKARRLGAIACARPHGAASWAESSPEAASFPATSSGSVTGPPGSNVIGIWLARGPGGLARGAPGKMGVRTARGGRGCWVEGSGERATVAGRGLGEPRWLEALAGSTGWQALTQVWLAGMRTIQDVRTRLLALICPFTTFTLAIARPHGLMRSILSCSVLASATT